MDVPVQPSSVFKALDTEVQCKPTLDTLEEKGINCVLMKAIYKLSILQQLLPYPLAEWVKGYQSMPLRMAKHNKITLPERKEPDRIMCLMCVKVKKYQAFLQEVLEETIHELYFHGTYYYLEYILCCENLKNCDDVLLKQDFLSYNEIIYFMNEKLNYMRHTFEKTLSYLSKMTGTCLEQAVVNSSIQAETVLNLTDVTQESRLNQTICRIRHKENAVNTVMKECLIETEEENKTNLEIENHIQLVTLRLQKEFEKWNVKYNVEIETLDVALLQIKSKLDETKEIRGNLIRKFNTRQELVSILQEEAELRDLEMELKVLQNKAATKIQAWWRQIRYMQYIRDFIKLKHKTPKLKEKLKKKK